MKTPKTNPPYWLCIEDVNTGYLFSVSQRIWTVEELEAKTRALMAIPPEQFLNGKPPAIITLASIQRVK